MKKIILVLILTFTIVNVWAQEFPIAVGNDSTFAISSSFDGTNYLIAIKGDNQSSSNATAQLVSPSGTLVGSRIFVGSNVKSMSIHSAFDGSNYLLVWQSVSDNIVGRFISPTGSLVGSEFFIASSSIDEESLELSFYSGSYFICYLKGTGLNHRLWGRTISTSGIIGNEIQISASTAREAAISFDGVKYLISYVERSIVSNKIYARFVSTSGSLIGNEITVVTGNYQRDNPISLEFDGDRFLLAYHEQDPNAHVWFLYGIFIDTTGVLQNKFMICDSSLNPFLPMLSFDGNNYLISWTQFTNGASMGQFYAKTGQQIGSPFVIFNTLNNKIPLGKSIFANNKFFAYCTRLNNNFTDGDVYGKFINTLTYVNDIQIACNFSLYPNPATDVVTLNIDNASNADLTLNIYNIIGTLIKTEMLKQNQPQINIEDLSNGIYMVEIKSKKWSEKQKLIIQK